MRVPPLLSLAADLFTWRRLVFNRFVLIVVIVAVASGGVSAYVGANDNGHVEGNVVDTNGDPVSNATVTLGNIPLQGVIHTESTKTDADGEFAFENQTQLLEYRLEVSSGNGTLVTKHSYNYFRGQDIDVTLEANRSLKQS